MVQKQTFTIDNPLKYRRYVWRGWSQWFHRIAEFGIPVPDGEHTLVPVQYANGEYGVLRGSMMVLNGHVVTHVRELRAFVNEDCSNAIREAKGMPEVVAVLSDSYKICVTYGTYEYEVYIRRRRDALVHEQVVVLAQ